MTPILPKATQPTTTQPKTKLPGTPPLAGATRALPPIETMVRATLERDASYEGTFFLGVTTTGIFCRPGCPARTPRRENMVFFPLAEEAMIAGFRACRRCHPLEPRGATPDWLRSLLEEIEQNPDQRFKDGDLRTRGLVPERVRRWFQAQHGMTFHAYQRARRLGRALGEIQNGGDLLGSAFESGFDSASGFAEALSKLAGVTPGEARQSTTVVVDRILSPLGPMIAAATDDALHLLEFANRRMLETQFLRVVRATKGVLVPGSNAIIDQVRRELDAYYSGKLRTFVVPCAMPGTEFQEAVWNELRQIPYGETRSYAELARAVERPTAIRAVGRTNGDNRLAIIVPCHRVVGADGSLTGYGGGLWRKQRLLEIDGARTPPPVAGATSKKS